MLQPLLLDASKDFGVKPFDKIQNVSIFLVPENEQSHEPLGRVRACDAKGHPLTDAHGNPVWTLALVLHWTAGTYSIAYNAYHGVFVFDPATRQIVIVKCLEWGQKGQHAYARNTGYVGLSAAGMKDAVQGHGNTIAYAGKYSVDQPEFIESMAVYGAEVCAWHAIDPRGYHLGPEYQKLPGGKLVATGRYIPLPNLLDHFILAQLDYPGERWDCSAVSAKVMKRLLEVYDELKAGHRQFQCLALVKGA